MGSWLPKERPKHESPPEYPWRVEVDRLGLTIKSESTEIWFEAHSDAERDEMLLLGHVMQRLFREVSILTAFGLDACNDSEVFNALKFVMDHANKAAPDE